jgi:hypothetical protein
MLGVGKMMDDMRAMMIFMRVKAAVDKFVTELQPVPIKMLKDWLVDTNAVQGLSPQQNAMRVFHVEVLEALIKAREFAQNDLEQYTKNN